MSTPFGNENRDNYQIGDCPCWDCLSNADKIEITSFIFGQISMTPPGSFRRLIYHRLGFKEDAYVPLYQAGGMVITNSVSEYYDMVHECK